MVNETEILVDFNKAGLDLEPEELESYIQRLAEDIKYGFAEDATLVRISEIPEFSKSGSAGFQPGLLKVVNPTNLKNLVDALGNRVYGSNLEIEFDGIKLKYRNSQQLEEQLQALERISQIKISVISGKVEEG
jgi:hypothetical protein